MPENCTFLLLFSLPFSFILSSKLFYNEYQTLHDEKIQLKVKKKKRIFKIPLAPDEIRFPERMKRLCKVIKHFGHPRRDAKAKVA